MKNFSSESQSNASNRRWLEMAFGIGTTLHIYAVMLTKPVQ